MATLKHPLSGAIYRLLSQDLVEVKNHNKVGLFYPDGRHHSGEITSADIHLIGWLCGEQLGPHHHNRSPNRLNKED